MLRLITLLITLIGFSALAAENLDNSNSNNSATTLQQQLEQSARQGDARSQFSLANMYHNGINVEQDYALAFYWYSRVAEKGHASAQFNVANGYYHGVGVEKDLSSAFAWYQKAADQGFVEAQFSLGVMYRNGEGTSANDVQAFEWYKKAADSGHATAQLIVAKMYDTGTGTAVNKGLAKNLYEISASQYGADSQFELAEFYLREGESAAAVEYYQLSAEQGHTGAQAMLGEMYYQGKLIDQDDALALQFSELAAQQNNVDAQFLVGQIYRASTQIDRDSGKTLYWFGRAAEGGQVKAQYQLATMYLKGDGVATDLQRAVALYQMAATQGHTRAQYSLALRYLLGSGVNKDASAAVHWFEKAARQGHVEAQYSLGMRYQLGSGVEKNIETSMTWYQKSAEQGNLDAEYRLAKLLLDGHGVNNNPQKAIAMLLDLAAQENQVAQYALYVIYQQGNVVEQDDTIARLYLQRAAEGGYDAAQYSLGKQYFDEGNIDDALIWLEKSIAQKNAAAQALLESIKQNPDASLNASKAKREPVIIEIEKSVEKVAKVEAKPVKEVAKVVVSEPVELELKAEVVAVAITEPVKKVEIKNTEKASSTVSSKSSNSVEPSAIEIAIIESKIKPEQTQGKMLPSSFTKSAKKVPQAFKMDTITSQPSIEVEPLKIEPTSGNETVKAKTSIQSNEKILKQTGEVSKQLKPIITGAKIGTGVSQIISLQKNELIVESTKADVGGLEVAPNTTPEVSGADTKVEVGEDTGSDLGVIAQSLSLNQQVFNQMQSLGIADHKGEVADISGLSAASSGNDLQVFLSMSRAAEEGSVESQNTLAMMYLQGIGTEVNFDMAYYWASESARSGNEEGKAILRYILSQSSQ
jgi:hypothetical protein